MKMTEIKEKAKLLGIEPCKMKKADLIHAIQKAEGYTPCFGKGDYNCPYIDCCFRDDCLQIQMRIVLPNTKS